VAVDRGNVVVSEIDGPVVKLELQGACGSCPSSTMTMKMGLERRLKEKIPEISEVSWWSRGLVSYKGCLRGACRVGQHTFLS
jgi:Fe-S cluster biogenesis protein NfuA